MVMGQRPNRRFRPPYSKPISWGEHTLSPYGGRRARRDRWPHAFSFWGSSQTARLKEVPLGGPSAYFPPSSSWPFNAEGSGQLSFAFVRWVPFEWCVQSFDWAKEAKEGAALPPIHCTGMTVPQGNRPKMFQRFIQCHYIYNYIYIYDDTIYHIYIYTYIYIYMCVVICCILYIYICSYIYICIEDAFFVRSWRCNRANSKQSLKSMPRMGQHW